MQSLCEAMHAKLAGGMENRKMSCDTLASAWEDLGLRGLGDKRLV
jgi:hypothetical protein